MSLLMQLTDVAERGRLEPITETVNAGEILHLVGPNGAGKSTLLARMAGMTGGEGQITLLEHTLADWSPVSLAHGAVTSCSSRCRPLRCRSGTI